MPKTAAGARTKCVLSTQPRWMGFFQQPLAPWLPGNPREKHIRSLLVAFVFGPFDFNYLNPSNRSGILRNHIIDRQQKEALGLRLGHKNSIKGVFVNSR